MKKKLLYVSLALALVLTALMPTLALAKARKPEATPFAGTAEVMVVDPGTSTMVGMKIITRGERIEGVFSSVEGWPALEGASLSVHHNSIITLSSPDPDTGVGEFKGKAWARMGVAMDGGRLFGIYRADISGEYQFTPDGQLVILWVLDQGTFKVMGRILDDGRTFVKANGEWAATLSLTPVGPGWTLAGCAQISGEYRTQSSRSK